MITTLVEDFITLVFATALAVLIYIGTKDEI